MKNHALDDDSDIDDKYSAWLYACKKSNVISDDGSTLQEYHALDDDSDGQNSS